MYRYGDQMVACSLLKVRGGFDYNQQWENLEIVAIFLYFYFRENYISVFFKTCGRISATGYILCVNYIINKREMSSHFTITLT
jgi:hypothetical protein